MKTRRRIAATLTAGLTLAIVGIAGVAPASAGGLDGYLRRRALR